MNNGRAPLTVNFGHLVFHRLSHGVSDMEFKYVWSIMVFICYLTTYHLVLLPRLFIISSSESCSQTSYTACVN